MLCHAPDKIADVGVVHARSLLPAPYAVTLDGLAFVEATPGDAATSRLEITFTVTDGGIPVTGLVAGNVRANLSKLVPGAKSTWKNYIVSSTTSRPTTETADATGAVFTNLGGGSYRFRLNADVQRNAAFDPAANHRLGMQISGTGVAATNAAFDFLGTDHTAPPSETRRIVTLEACNGCHKQLQGFHGSARYDPNFCVTCHTPDRAIGRTDPSGYLRDGEIIGDFTVLVHKIHMGSRLSKSAYNYAGVEFNHIGYPQDPRNCTTCHKGVDGDNWKDNPTAAACRSCHDALAFVSPPPAGMTSHPFNVTETDDCTSCHSSSALEQSHLTSYATANNPAVPTGLSSFEYEITNVTVDASNQAVVTFSIRKDGVALDLGTYPPTGFTGGPSFLVAYASPQGDVAAPRDWNQLGRTAGQPASVSVANVIGSATNNGDGTYTATLSSAPFPAGAVMRGVALQGYFTQQTTPTSGRYTPSVFRGVTGDPQRRVAINNAKCLNCHEMLSLHGGNRVNNVQVCVVCHNPNLSSSGRGADLSLTRTGGALDATNATIAAL